MSIISICNQKGGVGKTTLTYHLAWGLYEAGQHVLLIDIDPQGNLTSLFEKQDTCNVLSIFNRIPELMPKYVAGNIEERSSIFLVSSNIHLSTAESNTTLANYTKLKRALEYKKTMWDYVLIDCPPSLGLFTMNSFTASDYIFIPTLPYRFSLIGLQDLMEVIDSIKMDGINPALRVLGVAVNQTDRTVVAREALKELEETFPKLLFSAKIPKTIRIEEALQSQKPLWWYDPLHPASDELRNLTKEFIQRVEGGRSNG